MCMKRIDRGAAAAAPTTAPSMRGRGAVVHDAGLVGGGHGRVLMSATAICGVKAWLMHQRGGAQRRRHPARGAAQQPRDGRGRRGWRRTVPAGRTGPIRWSRIASGMAPPRITVSRVEQVFDDGDRGRQAARPPRRARRSSAGSARGVEPGEVVAARRPRTPAARRARCTDRRLTRAFQRHGPAAAGHRDMADLAGIAEGAARSAGRSGTDAKAEPGAEIEKGIGLEPLRDPGHPLGHGGGVGVVLDDDRQARARRENQASGVDVVPARQFRRRCRRCRWRRRARASPRRRPERGRRGAAGAASARRAVSGPRRRRRSPGPAPASGCASCDTTGVAAEVEQRREDRVGPDLDAEREAAARVRAHTAPPAGRARRTGARSRAISPSASRSAMMFDTACVRQPRGARDLGPSDPPGAPACGRARPAGCGCATRSALAPTTVSGVAIMRPD